jgi:hypothetical protein
MWEIWSSAFFLLFHLVLGVSGNVEGMPFFSCLVVCCSIYIYWKNNNMVLCWQDRRCPERIKDEFS